MSEPLGNIAVSSIPPATPLPVIAGNEDPPPPIKGLRRLLVWIVPANLALFLIWNSVPNILLPQGITVLFGEDDKVANLAIVVTVGGLISMLAQPIAGRFSDRVRSRVGRRTPFIVIGALCGALALVGLALADTLLGLVIGWGLVQICYSFAQAPLNAVMPDRVPVKRRGTFSSVAALGVMGGNFGGAIIGSLVFDSVIVGYLILSVVSVVLLTLFVVFNPDYPSTGLKSEPLNMREFLSTFWVSPIKHPDFFWAFLGRILLYTGYFAISGYQVYLLTDYFGVEDPASIIAILSLIGVAGIAVASIISGPISDRIGRRKPFVFAAAIVVGCAYMLPWVWQDVTAYFVMTFLAGFGFGMFQAVDQALVSLVLPSSKTFGKDLGIVNIALMLPQTLAAAAAGVIVLSLGYGALFPLAALAGLLGALAVLPIKATK